MKLRSTETIFFFLFAIARIVGVMSAVTYIGPSLGPGNPVVGTSYFMADSLVLPTCVIKGIEYYIDVSVNAWSPFVLAIFHPIGIAATTTQYRIVGTYSVTAAPSVVTGITGQNFSSANYITATAGDLVGVYTTSSPGSIAQGFDNTFVASMLVSNSRPNASHTTGDVVTFDRHSIGPYMLSLRLLIDPVVLVTCAGGGSSACAQLCTDGVGGYSCSCQTLYYLDPTDNTSCLLSPRTCANVGNSYCAHNCTDTGAGYACSCRTGFTLQSNGYSCVESGLSLFIGEAGRTGAPGERGLQGPNGHKGEIGETGPRGLQAATGVKGEPGSTGVVGHTGTRGVNGDKGDKGTSGAGGVTGENGVPGLAGDTGPDGAVGPRGFTGSQGTTGLDGTQGVTGEKGQKGAMGPEGITGETGERGANGLQGAEGGRGLPGGAGVAGIMGITGQLGATGQTGPEYEDADECSTNNVCSHGCVNTWGSYYCTCRDGYTLDTDGRECDASSECDVSNGRCQHTCTEQDEGYVCSCLGGYHLGADRHSCIDDNECSNLTHSRCTSNEMCVNTPGNWTCVPSSVTVACTNADAERRTECQTSSSGLVSSDTVLGFIVWLVLLSLVVFGILGCVLCIMNSKDYRRNKYVHDPYDNWDTKSGRHSAPQNRLPEATYAYYG